VTKDGESLQGFALTSPETYRRILVVALPPVLAPAHGA